MIEAGKLRHRITFQLRNSEKNRRGQRGDNWTDIADASAQITEMNGSEREQAQAAGRQGDASGDGTASPAV